MKTYKCIVCEDIVIKKHCFNHWEKHYNIEASGQRLGLKLLDLDDVDEKLENTFSAKVTKKFKGMNDTEKDAMIIDKGTCVNSDPQNSIEINVDNEKKSNAETLDLNRGVIEDTNEDIEGKQHNSNGGDALRHTVDHEMKCYDSGEDTDAVVVVQEEVRPDLHLNKYGSLNSTETSRLPTNNNEPKTSAARQRDYRFRLKEERSAVPKKRKENSRPTPAVKSAAERQREYRLRKKNKKNVNAESTQVIARHIFVEEPVDLSHVCTETSSLPKHNKNTPNTSAVRQREYRLRLKDRSGPRKRIENRQTKKTAAERQREYRLRLKERSGPKKPKENSRPMRKSAAERQRECRLRKKMKNEKKYAVSEHSSR